VINTFVRPADSKDQRQLSNLIFFETRLHRHLDWRSPLEWLGAPYYWALEEGGQIMAALACPEELRGIAWVRLFVYTGHWSAEAAWNLLWATARQEIEEAGGAKVRESPADRPARMAVPAVGRARSERSPHP
jgi:hypothetical protein